MALPARPTTGKNACGSGGTGAGLIVGAKLHGLPARLAGVNVCDDRAYFVDAIGRIAADLIARWTLPIAVGPDDIDIVDGHVGRGYAKSRPEELITIRDLCRRDGLVLDPVYTGRAAAALIGLVRQGAFGPDENVLFWHTGGTAALYAYAAETLAG